MKEEPALEEEGSWEAVTIPQARCADRLISYIINDIILVFPFKKATFQISHLLLEPLYILDRPSEVALPSRRLVPGSGPEKEKAESLGFSNKLSEMRPITQSYLTAMTSEVT